MIHTCSNCVYYFPTLCSKPLCSEGNSRTILVRRASSGDCRVGGVGAHVEGLIPWRQACKLWEGKDEH